ncbi:Two pore calcium channel protein 1 [Capsicum baccatum]|uniref:Two pore calcium channel protein 1 n=2 Tax=Capsicum TaxID=4071 RepID=A0A1U8HHX4_CAPAN|nr:two pore calcium channel protein 1B [Capsicum annuum]KAF3659657.1 Two pore calcium channel protein 1 [Capsicum annuum]PHT43413.1 Two pore calcium channel protein 1 [Capsicum baccatum]PHT76653.1 Two pore calcium channel protein 1 [Capsicum annuum]
MDESLLPGESSSSWGRVRNRRWSGSNYDRREAIAHGSAYQKAAALVDLAEDGVGLPEEILEGSSFGKAAQLYFVFTRFDFLWSINYLALVVLNFLEKPLWCSKHLVESCNNRGYYYLGQLPFLTGAESLIYEGVTFLLLAIHVLFPISYEGFHLYWRSLLNRLKVILLLILVADIVVYILFLADFYYLPFRIAPYLRVVFFILNIRELRDSFFILAGMLRTYLNVVALTALFLLFSSWLGYVLFEDTQQGKKKFTSYGTTLYQMFVLFTTSNNPDVWIPAYKESRWFCLFFVLYVLLGVYFVTNLVLAVVYDSFKSELVKQVAEKDRRKLRTLKKAFTLIDDSNNGFLDKKQCIRLFEELNKYRTLPKISGDDFEAIFTELDDTGDFKINLEEFADLCTAIGLRFQKEDSLPIFEACPNFYHSPASESLRNFVRGNTFEYIIVFILLVNLVAVIIETTLDIQNNSGQTFWQKVEFIFGWLYVVEMALKVYTYGFENYWRDGQNRFDFVITWVIVIGETATFVAPNDLTFLSNGEWIRYLLIARMLRLIRLLLHVDQYRGFVATFLTLIPSLMPYLGTIFCILCFYCSIGLQIFGGMVNAGNPNLASTDLADNDYYLFNFNDYPSGMVTLFNILVMGNWQVWMQTYKELTGTAWSYVYFVSFYLISVLWLLNLIVAFVLEAFQAEMALEASASCVDDEDKESRSERRRNVGTKTRSQRVDFLLHHMLSSELTECSNDNNNP